MFRTALTLFTVVSLTACGETQNDISNEDLDDVAVVTGALITDEGGEIQAMTDTIDTASGQPPAMLSRSGSGSWTGQRGTLDYTYDLDCFDSMGTEQSACDGTTDSAQATLSWEGLIDTQRRYAELSRSGTWTIEGLTTDSVTFSGSGRFLSDSEFQALVRPVMRSMSMDYRATFDNVVFDRSVGYPVSGRIQFAIDAARTEARRFRDIQAEFETTAVVEFSAEGSATIVVNGQRSYTVDMRNGEVAVDDTSTAN